MFLCFRNLLLGRASEEAPVKTQKPHSHRVCVNMEAVRRGQTTALSG